VELKFDKALELPLSSQNEKTTTVLIARWPMELSIFWEYPAKSPEI
jgi:hypothetical protein